jgi:DNA-binding NarL/FixJ family response regulator
MTTLQLALADDQALIRASLRTLLESMGHRVAVEAQSGQQLVAALQTETVDVIVSDIRMPAGSGIEALAQLRGGGNHTPCLFLTTFDDSELLLQAVEAGAQGFMLKDASTADLAHALQRIAEGAVLLQPISSSQVRAHYQYHNQQTPAGTFNAKEVNILRLMAGGYSNKEIARSLFLAEGTVKNYVSDILEKLGTRDRTRAVLKAITLRII